MDFLLQVPFLYIILGLFGLAYLVFHTFFRVETRQPPLPPGSFGWPIIGETLELQRLSQAGLPGEFNRIRMMKYNKEIYKTSVLFEKTIAFSGAAANRFLFTAEKRLVQTWWPTSLKKLFGEAFFTAPYDKAVRTRKVVSGFLQQEVMNQMVERFDKTCKNCINKDWIGKEQVLAFTLIKKYAFDVACDMFASMNHDDDDDDDSNWKEMILKEFNVLLKGVFQLPIYFPGTRHYNAVRSSAVIRRELIKVIEKKRLNKDLVVEKDVISHLMETRDEDGKFLTDTEIADNVILLMDSGHDTSSSTMMMLMKYLAQFPDCYKRVLEEQREIASQKAPHELLNKDDISKMKYSWNVVNEVLRLMPPINGTFRKAIVDFTYAGFTVPKGWMLWWNTTSTHKVDEYFPNPEEFDPLRFERDTITPYSFVPFGGGPRMCPGREFARIEILVFLHNLVKEFRWELLFPNEVISVDPMPTSHKGLPVYLYPHQMDIDQ